MDALTNTNSPIMYDLRRFGREVMGIKPGTKMDPKSEEFKFIADQAKKFNEARMKALASGPSSEPRYMSLTNAEGRVIDVMIKPDGEPIVVNPQTLNTQQGMFTQVNPTNVAPIIDPRTGQQVKGYASRIDLGEDGATLGAYTPGAAAPQQTPAPTPEPQAAPAPAPQADQPVRVIAPDGRQGIIPAAQIDQAIKQGFRVIAP